MKKLILIYTFILSSLATVAQEWKAMTIDDSVQIALPPGYEKKDTLGQTLINAKSSFGNIIITKQPDNPASTPDIEKKKQLDSYYSDFVKRISSTSKGTVRDEKDTILNKLRVREFTLEVDSGSGKQFRHIRILHVNNATYTFQFLYKEIHAGYAEDESRTFFKSITIPPDIGLSSQFTSPENTTGKSASGNNNLLMGAGVLLVIIIVIIIILRKKKRRR